MAEEIKEEVRVEELEDEEAAKAFAQDEQAVDERMTEAMDPGTAQEEPPPWAVLPPGMKLPPQGTQVAFMRFEAGWTRTPAKGDRTCACWPIDETEEVLAYQRSRGNPVRSLSELAKASVRMVDGQKANWNPGAPGSISKFWSEIGPKGRAMIRNWYIKTHNVTDEEALDFFSRHFVNVTVQQG